MQVLENIGSFSTLATYQDNSSGTWFAKNLQLPVPAGLTSGISGLVTGNGNAGLLQLFGGDVNGNTFLVDWQDATGNWNGGHILDTSPVSHLVAGNGNQGNLQVIGLDNPTGSLRLAAWQDSGGNWHPGKHLPSPFNMSEVAVANGFNNNLIAVGISNSVVVVAAYLDNAGNWQAGGSLPSQVTSLGHIVAISGNSGNLEVLDLNFSGHVQLADWQNNSTGAWHAGFELPGQTQALSTIAAAHGNGLELVVVIGIGSDGQAYAAGFLDNAGTWHAGFLLPVNGSGVRYTSIKGITGNGGNLQVVALGTDGKPYVAGWQDTSGSWHSGFPLF